MDSVLKLILWIVGGLLALIGLGFLVKRHVDKRAAKDEEFKQKIDDLSQSVGEVKKAVSCLIPRREKIKAKAEKEEAVKK